MYKSLIKQRIAILGATGYIGRSLLAVAMETDLSVTPFSRNIKKAETVLASYGVRPDNILSYDVLLNAEYDVIINATGVGSPKKLFEDPDSVFTATEEMDALVFEYLKEYPATMVFNISSGSIYGLTTVEPNINDLKKEKGYPVAKLMSEMRHREAKEYAIVDLRVFAFVSRLLDLNESFFISEVARCLREKKVFHTTSADMVRDYATANDLWDVIEFLTEKGPMNAFFDMQSQSPVSKFALLDHLAKEEGLTYEVSDDVVSNSPTGVKNEYYSKSTALSQLGYSPQYSSLQNVLREIKAMI